MLMKIRARSSSTHMSILKCFFSSQSQLVILRETNNKGIISLNRPKALNAFNHEMLRVIYPTLKDWESRKLDLVIIKGEGGKAFCAGGDIRQVTSAEYRESVEQAKFFALEYQINNLIGNLDIPFVAVIDGITMGGGAGLSVNGKFRIATEKTIFAMPETGIGLFPDVGSSFFLSRLKGELGTYLAITGDRLKGGDCLHAGIATHVCPSSKTTSLTEDLLNLPRDCKNEDIEELLNKYTKMFPKTPFSLENKVLLINETFNGNSVEEILEKLANKESYRSKEEKEWSRNVINRIFKLSPTSVKVALKQIREGRKLKCLSDCLKMEYRLVTRFCTENDFYEGVRALLIDRDGKPSWNPDSLSNVSSEYVNKYFEKLSEDQELKF